MPKQHLLVLQLLFFYSVCMRNYASFLTVGEWKGHTAQSNPFGPPHLGRNHVISRQVLNIFFQRPIHSKKFKMNNEVDSFLSEKVSN